MHIRGCVYEHLFTGQKQWPFVKRKCRTVDVMIVCRYYVDTQRYVSLKYHKNNFIGAFLIALRFVFNAVNGIVFLDDGGSFLSFLKSFRFVFFCL